MSDSTPDAPLRVPIALIAAVGQNGVIGDDGAIPWRLSTDMKRFRRLTVGKPVVMGRTTFETLPAPLKDRPNIVVSRRAGYRPEGAVAFASLDAALAEAGRIAADSGAGEVFVIGGGEVYAAALPRADRLYITHVALAPAGDAHFPAIDEGIWRAVSSEDVPAGERDDAPSRFVVYERRNGAPER